MGRAAQRKWRRREDRVLGWYHTGNATLQQQAFDLLQRCGKKLYARIQRRGFRLRFGY